VQLRTLSTDRHRQALDLAQSRHDQLMAATSEEDIAALAAFMAGL
jgi:hypothetical protein